MEPQTLGILGTGHLASYTIAGLRNSKDDREIILSPRNSTVASKLAREHQCKVAQTNQQVIDEADIVLLSVRPHQFEELVANLTFKSAQLIISAIAGITLGNLQSHPSLKDTQIVRTLPIVSAQLNCGPVPLYPNHPLAKHLLGGLGEIVILDNETQFDIATVHACMHGWIYFWLDEMVNWTCANGIERPQAESMVKQTVEGALKLSDHLPFSLNEIGNQIATPGTYTLFGLEQLRAEQALKLWPKSMQSVLDRLMNE